MSKLDETLLYRWFHQVWNSKEDDSKKAIETLMATDAEFDGIETKDGKKGAEGFKLFYDEFTSQFSDIYIEVQQVVSEGNMESARTVINATHTASGKKVIVPGICMVRKESDQIAEAWNSYDFLSLNLQLGQKLVPA